MNSCDGLDQVKSLLGTSLPSDLIDCDKFLTISFRYFAAAMRLFKDSIWLEQYEYGACELNHREIHQLNKLAACILFNFRHGVFEEPEKIVKLYIKTLHQQCNSDKSAMEEMNNIVVKLKSLSQKYCHGATMSITGAAFKRATDVSISVMPQPNFENVSFSIMHDY